MWCSAKSPRGHTTTSLDCFTNQCVRFYQLFHYHIYRKNIINWDFLFAAMVKESPSGFSPTNRRSVLKNVGAVSGGFLAITGGASGQHHTPFEDAFSVAELAMEYEQHPKHSAIAFTAVTESDGYQAYLARDVDSPFDIPSDVEQLTEADHGVHGLSWERSNTLSYSRDGSTYEQPVSIGQRRWTIFSSERKVDTEPRPIPNTSPNPQAQRVTTQGGYKVVKCTNVPHFGDWCVRVHAADGPEPTPSCPNSPYTVPSSMIHHHILDVMPAGEPNKGINIWVGIKDGCLWFGEENALGKCYRLCKDGRGWPGFNTFVNNWKKILAAAVAAAGLSMHSTVLQALAYIKAGLSVKPPMAVPV